MNPWRTFVLWLARKEILEITSVWVKALAEHTAMAEKASAFIEQQAERAAKLCDQIEVVKSQAYAEGQVDGRKEMHDYIDGIVKARSLGTGDYVSLADLAMAKKGLIH